MNAPAPSSPDAASIQLDVVLEPRDVIAGIALEYLRPSAALLLATVVPSVFVAPVLAIYAGAIDVPGFALSFAGAYLLIAALGFLSGVLIQIFRLRNPKWCKGKVGAHALTLTASGITERTADNEEHVRWQEVDSVTSAMGYLRIRFGRSYFPVPIRTLPPELPAAELLRTLQRWQRAGSARRAGRRWLKGLIVASGAGLAVLGMVFSHSMFMGFHGMLKTFDIRSQQANYFNINHHLVPQINEFRRTQGRLPRTLDEIPDRTVSEDGFMRPFHYETRGEAYILASFGRDGARDHADYWSIREMPVVSGDGLRRGPQSVCRRFDADTVFSDRGPHFACAGK